MEYSMGKPIKLWREADHAQITFVVTQECDLRCKYCYIVNKNNSHKMTIETAKKIVDYFLDNQKELELKDAVVLDFIGGEPLLEIDLIDKIVDYFKIQAYLKKSPWWYKYRILMSSNGIKYKSSEVQKFIRKNENMCYIGITIDGTEFKHNLNRIFPNGEGSYKSVVESVKLWIKQYAHPVTKVTISHDDLPYIKESIIHLWNLGLKDVPANVVFEDVWKENDDTIFQNQLIALADYAIDNSLWKSHNTTLFSDHIGYKRLEEDLIATFCGTGTMFSVDSDGIIYPCLRYMEYSLENQESFILGDIYNGVQKDRRRVFKSLTVKNQSSEKCLECNINGGCMTCNGYSYQTSSLKTNFDRNISICKMHKARVRANNYYWARLYNEFNIDDNGYHGPSSSMIILLSDYSQKICHYSNNGLNKSINANIFKQGLEDAFQNFYQPFIVHPESSRDPYNSLIEDPNIKNMLRRHIVLHICPYEEDIKYYKNTIFVFTKKNINYCIKEIELKNCILIIDKDEVSNMASWTTILLKHFDRVNIQKQLTNNNYNLYKEELVKIEELLESYFLEGNIKEVNVITDRIFLKEMNNCFAGERSITLSPTGDYYICPAFYHNNMESVATLKMETISPIIEMTKLKKAPLCLQCDAFHCQRCIFDNKILTNEMNIPSKIQCESAHFERKLSQKLCQAIINNGKDKWNLKLAKFNELNYDDPIELYRTTERRMNSCES